MIASLFFIKFNVRRLIAWLVIALLLGALSVFAYTPGPLSGLQFVRGEMPELFTLLGFVGESNLSTFVLSYLFGLLLPLLISAYSIRTSRSLISQPMEDGRMAMLIASGHRKAPILITHAFVLVLGIFLILLSVFIGQTAAALIFSLEMDLLSFLRMHGGFFLVSLLLAMFCLFIAATSFDDIRTKRLCRGFSFLMLLFWLLSRLPGQIMYLRYLTIWSLFEGFGLASGSGGTETALVALLLAFVFLVLSLFAFQKREL